MLVVVRPLLLSVKTSQDDPLEVAQPRAIRGAALGPEVDPESGPFAIRGSGRIESTC